MSTSERAYPLMTRSSYIGRIAPSPTGLLHLGHARTFSIAYDCARAQDGELHLRNEDLDPERTRPEFVNAMHEDLRWLGIAWTREITQSERLPAYREALQQLLAQGAIYACTCTRKDLQQATEAPHEDTDDEPIYNGRCRPEVDRSPGAPEPALSLPKGPDSRTWVLPDGINLNYRFRVPDGESIAFLDRHCGPQSFTAGCNSNADFGDFLVWRKDGLPSYQLACAVDDASEQITEVVRGRDLLKSTARQILLQRALGLTTPAYFHTDLLRDAHGTRLAKRHDALSLCTLRAQGHTPAQVRAMF